jgi:hypothetical protein
MSAAASGLRQPRRAAPATITIASVLALAAFAGAPAGAAEETVQGWTLSCEAGTCRASLPSLSGLQALTFGRFAGEDRIALGFASQTAIPDRERPITLRLDNRPLGTLAPERGYAGFERPEAFWLLDGKTIDAILQGAGPGRRLRIEYLDVTGAPHDADFRLDGLAALIDRTDAMLDRKARREGVAPGRALPPPPSIGKAALIMRQGLPARLLERHRAASDCEDPQSPLLKPLAPVIGPLSRTAMLYGIPCAASGGQVSYKLWVLESGEIGGMTPLFFALYDPVFGWRGTDLLPNIAFEPGEARLTARSGARSDAGCGGRGVWRWKDYGFAMEEYRYAPDCGRSRNPVDWPKVFPLR